MQDGESSERRRILDYDKVQQCVQKQKQRLSIRRKGQRGREEVLEEGKEGQGEA